MDAATAREAGFDSERLAFLRLLDRPGARCLPHPNPPPCRKWHRGGALAFHLASDARGSWAPPRAFSARVQGEGLFAASRTHP